MKPYSDKLQAKSYLNSLRHALTHTREVFAKLDGCKLEEVTPSHPEWHLVFTEQYQFRLFEETVE